MTTIADRGRSAEILLVDDNEDDVFLTRRAFRGSRLPVNLHHVDNGEKCLAFLRKQAPYAGAPSPDIVLLDINMPVMNGHEVLEAIESDPRLKHVVVLVLTTSAEESDVQAMYGRRCNSYITKPVDFDKFEHAVRLLTDYWLGLVVLPSR